ncbi:hypothetical protein M1583_01800 [Candidatus Marsarchaeota archaeon]|nr:hypothetical protein [Candidatus Marsarchaeota archaeon]
MFSGMLTQAQLGEQAGQPTLNISVGSIGTFNYSILNSGSTPLSYKVILPTLNTIPHNATPTVTVTPMNGTLAPNSQQVISIKVNVPSGDKPYLKWQGILSVVVVAPAANITSGAGAVIREGVAKILTVESAPPRGIPLIYYLIAALVIVIAIVVAVYFALKKKSRSKAPAHKVSTAEVKARIKGTSAKSARRTTRKAVKRKPKGRSSKRVRKGGAKTRSKKPARKR